LSAAILCLLWILWTPLAFAGGLAFSPVVGLAAVATLPGVARRLRPKLYIIGLLAFLAFAAASTLWSPRPFTFIDINLAEGDFNVRSEVVRVALLMAALGVLLAVAARLDGGARRLVSSIATGALLVQLAVVAALTVFETQALELFSPLMPNSGEGVQNISRNSLIMAVAAPSLILGLAENRSRPVAILVGLCVVAVEGAILAGRGVHAGLLALAAAGVCAAIVRLFPKRGFQIIAAGIAVLVMTAPLVFGYLVRGADASSATSSVDLRLAIWNRVHAIIMENPLSGAGLGVLRTIDETIPSGAFAGNLLVPNHAHNMALQLWAETGAVGASLLALAILLAAWRLPPPADLGRAAPRVAALAGAMTATIVSFDLWNEWWWAVGGLLAVLAAIVPRGGDKAFPGEEARETVFGDGADREVAPAAEPVSAQASAETESDQDPAGQVPAIDAGNNFNLLRLVFAGLVVAYHVVILSGVPAWSPGVMPLAYAAEAGVQGFFIMSGYLVMGSLERSRSLGGYADKRMRRLYPAYAAIVLMCAIAALAVSPEARADLLGVARYLGANLVFLNFLEPGLPGLFETNPFNEVNSALWTLKIEVMFYLILPVLAWTLMFSGRLRWALLLSIYIAAEVWRGGLQAAGEAGGRTLLIEVSRQLPGQMSFFVTGVALYLWRRDINWRSPLPVVGLALLVASFAFPFAEPMRAIGLGVVSVWAAVAAPRLIDAARFGDLSYGAYIVHFPIIQAFVAAGLFASSAALGAGVSVVATLIAALAMWRLVERPALRADSAYRT